MAPSCSAKPKFARGPPLIPPKDRCIINTLPTELLSHIFVLGLELVDKDVWDIEAHLNEEGEESIPQNNGDPDCEDVESDSKDEDEEVQGGTEPEPDWQILVSAVCRRWREVALEIPQLWSKVIFTEKSSLEKAYTYLRRTKGAPLKICIDFTNDSDESHKIWPPMISDEDYLMARTKGIISIITTHMKRVAILEVMVKFWRHMSVLLAFLGSCDGAPMLEVLRLSRHELEDEDDIREDGHPLSPIPESDKQQDFLLFKGDLPRLRHVALWGVHVDWEKSLFLKNLTMLELSYHEADLAPSFKAFARILRSSPNLNALTILQSGPRGGPIEWLESVTGRTNDVDADLGMQIDLPNVKTFVLASVDRQYAIDLMDCLVLTGLYSLTLDFGEGDSTEFISSLIKPHRVTGKSILSTLTHVRLGGLGVCKKQVLDDMAFAMQNITSLYIEYRHLGDATWYDFLIPPLGRKVHFPCLEELHSIGLPGFKLVELVRARKVAGVPLQQLFVGIGAYMDEDEEQWLKEKSGLKTFELFAHSDDSDEEESYDGTVILDEEDMDSDDD
ncbi:hypothetical protein BXZ70DRAFT_950085 [Cristinia sonorae]|uniref:F-box domain-containing protein n=1 Tax=Cristinia sonorae TaxID=1940300 RepID=A0A8K0UKG4_9AGAR|nr:hypothetical protein BXZ70DRAFT_950085 [Cristinia sonorae]